MTDRDDHLGRDIAHRALALDVGQSFLVQAPAGSGKTELLIQRYLALLGVVDRPERVLAMTFTRKAAAEMRERISRALRAAADAEAAPAVSDHELKTRTLAAAALARDRAQGWQLVAHPARLAIYTIDAFCASIVRQAPIATGLGSLPRFEEHAEPLYRQAAREALAAAPAGDSDWRALLAHLDNDAERVVALLASMLAKRDQWLRHLGIAQAGVLRRRLELALQQEIDGELDQVRRMFTPATLAAIARCAAYASANLDRDGGNEDLSAALARCVAAGGLPPAQFQHQGDWRTLADWLMVKGASRFRKSIDARSGIPAKAGGKAGAADRIAGKDDVEQLLRSLEAGEGMADALHIARSLPPSVYGEASWAMVAALLAVLPQAAAELALVFAAEGAVDFVELTLAALRALGPADEPTDLLLRLDSRYEHLLVDEFQDTSDSQYELLASLTAGWTNGDGRTLFAVGDPMQSIYRFREAEVRLFLDAQANARIGNVPVALRRSHPQLPFTTSAGRVGQCRVSRGARVAEQSMARGRVVRARRGHASGAPRCTAHGGPRRHVHRRSRSCRPARGGGPGRRRLRHRGPGARPAAPRLILPALRAARIPFAAVELDALGTRQSVLDIASLAHALLQPADRLASLAALRAPWCGLPLADLLAVAPHAALGLCDLLVRRHEIAGVSDGGRVRLDRVAEALLPAFAERGRRPFRECIRGAWLALGGPATVDEAIDLDAASRFLGLVAEHETGGDVRDGTCSSKRSPPCIPRRRRETRRGYR